MTCLKATQLATMLLLSMLFSLPTEASVDLNKCTSAQWPLEKLQKLKTDPSDSIDKQALALQLRHCLASPEPDIRDELAYGLLSQWMRDTQLTETTRQRLFSELVNDIAVNTPSDKNVYLPFAVLTLSEVVRTDRINSFLSDEQREMAIHTVAKHLNTLSDYRGFSEDVGWRHAVAHSADVYLQMALNPAVSNRQLKAMAESVSGQINPSQHHFYHYGEPQRLARATAYLMLRETIPVTFWQSWLAEIASPSPFASWQDVYRSDRGLAKRHNTRAFLLELSAMIAGSNHTRLQKINRFLSEFLKHTA
ncbi:DUF2785 domain-containing protein [Alteromonas halophila]|uniref:DUF2785 domain-containing protein n=1 Tax=Alteromonas halophila TaxID=516698 RepID=A0A918JKZ5_9ALTE|nr:DUF2785 domain-containing protein [Alteromonas halophila]GGW87236.1 hypothetical protein GCM10007391_21390 [Alteromonas halophila]